jgi:hypothetical protein
MIAASTFIRILSSIGASKPVRENRRLRGAGRAP